MGILDDGSWSDIGTTSQTKSADLFDKAVQKQANIHRKAAGLKSQREVQGVQPILDEGVNSFTYDNVNSARNDGDSHGATTDEGYDHGQRFKYNDTPETKNLTASQRATQYPWAASYYGIPLERVTDELIYASGRMSTDRKNALISEGQGTLTEEGFVERSPADMQPVYDKDGELISGMEPQWYRIEGESTYDPASTRYKGDKRIKFDSVTNPYTGVDVIEAMNTPEHNVRWFNDNPRQNAIREAYDAEHGTAKGAGTLPSLVQVKANRKYGFDVFRPKDASNPTHTGFRKNNLNEVDAKRLADLANKHPEATLDELMGSTVSNSLAKFGQSTLNITGDLAQGASRPVRAALELNPIDTDLKELTKKRFQHGTAFMPKTDTDHKIKDYYFDDNAQISGINLDRAHDRFLDLSERSRSQFSAEDTEFYDSFLGKSFQDANETVVATKWRAAASKETAEQIDAYSKLLDDVVIRTMRAQREDARFTKTYQSIAHNEDGSAKDLSYKALGAITAFSEMYANDPTQAPIDFFTNLPYMVGLVYTGIPGAAALISAKDEDLVAEWQEMNPGKTQTSEERFITAGSSALAVGAEYFGDRFILKGKLELLQKAMDRVAVKSNILTKAVVKTGEYATKGVVSTVVEGASGGTTEFAEQYAVEQDLTKIDDTKVSLSAAHEARAGSAGGAIMDAGRDVLPNDVNTNKVKLDKRNDILKNDKLTDQQRARVVKSRDKTIQNLIGQRHKIKLKDIDTVVGLSNIPEKIKKSLKQLISKNELEDTDLDAYLDELNTIAQFSNAITGESGTTIEDSQTLLYILKNKPEEEIVDPTNPKDAKEALAGHYRLITALEKGIAEHNRRAQIDVILAQVTDIDSSDALTITVLNNARKNAIAYTKANAADNIQYIKDDYKDLTSKHPENTATYAKREAEEIANEEQILADELIRLNTPIAKTLDKAKVTAVNSESANTSFKPVGGIDVTHPTYNAQSEVDQILDKGIKTIIKDPELSKNLLIHNSNLDIQIKNLIKAGNTEDAAILQGQRKSYDEIVAAIRKKVTDEKTRTEVVPTETEEVLFSIDPSTLDNKELNNLDDSKLTEEQLELKRLQLERSALNSERADKNVADVHEEIMFGDNDTKRSFTYYEGQANDAMTGTERNQLGKFVQHMNKKSEVLSGAYNQVISGTPNTEIEVDAAPAIDYVKESANELNKISNYLHGAIDREMSGMFASMMKGTAHQMLNKELSQFSNLDNITENSLKGMRSMMLDKMQGQVSNKNIAEYVKAFDAYAQGVLNMQKAKALDATTTPSKTTKKVAAQVIWIKKDDLDAAPILQAVEYVDNPAGLEYENLENPEQVTSHYKIHRNSGNLIKAIKKEAEYGVVTEQVINKILDGKQAITDQNADRFSADEITAIENALPTEMSDLDVQTLNTGEIVDDTTETAEPVEVVQTESVEAETVEKVETTPTNDKDIIKNIEAKIQEKDFTAILTCSGASCTINSKIVTGILDDLGVSSFVVDDSFIQDTTDGGTKRGDHTYTIANINNRLYVIDAPQNEFMVYDTKNGTIKIKKGVDRSKVKPRITPLSDLSTRYEYDISPEGFLDVPKKFEEAAKNTPLNQKNVVDSYLLGIEGSSAFENVHKQIEKDGITTADIIANPDKVVDALKESYAANNPGAPFVIKRDLKKIEGLRIRGKLPNITSGVNTETVPVKVSTDAGIDSNAKTTKVKPEEFPVTIGKQELVIKGAKVYSAKSGKEVTVQRTINRAFGVKAHNEGRAVNVTYKDKSYLVNDKGVILTKAKTNSGNIVHTKEDSVRAGILEAANQAFIQKGSPIRLVEQVDIAEVIVEDAQQTKANAVELNKVPVVKAKAKPTESKKVVVETEVIAEITKVNTDGTVGIPGNSIIKQYDGKFPNISSQSGEGNITNHFGTKNKKRESVFTLSKSGGVSIDTIKSSSEVLVAKVNQKLQEKGQDPIDANPMYLEILGNTVTNFKKDYAAKGPKIATTAGVSVTKSLKAFHVKDSQGKYTLPDEVFLAAAITGLQWLSENSGRLNSKDDTQVKGFLGLESKEKLSNTERATVEDMGFLFPDASGRLGKQIVEALNIKALRDTEYVLKRGEGTVSPEHTQESVEMALGMLALTMLSSIDASTIETRFNPGSGPLIHMQNVKLTDLPIRSNIDSETLVKDAEGNTIDPAEGNFLMDETGNFINTFVDKYGNVKEVSHPMSKKTFTTLRRNDVITSASNKQEESNALSQFTQFIRSQSGHAEALLGYNISKNGVFSKPVLEVQTTMRGSLSQVSTRRQALMKRLQSIPQQGKVGELALWNSLSLEAQQHISGVTDVDTKHITRRDSFTASNKALIQEIDIINMYDNAVFYYQYGVQKQGRMMIKSSGINPMNSKIHRHLVAAKSNPTTVTAKDTAMRNIFKIAVAAAFGAPIDKQGAQKSIDDFADIMGNPVVTTALDILRDPEQAALHEEAILSVHEFIQVDPAGNETKPYANKVHLLEGLAALLAYSEGDFKTGITVEIDGITNGYAISLLQFGGKNLKQALAQVGVSLGNAEDYGTWLADPSNIDVYFSLAKEMNAQLNSASIVEYYEKAYTDPSTGELKYPKGLLAVMERLTKSVNGKPVVNTNAFIALDRIDGEIENKEGDLTKFARDLAKDPLMTTNYSAQLNTVLGKMTKSAIESMHDKMAKIQLEYDTGDKGKAEKSAKDLGNAIGLFLGFEVGTVNLVAELAQGNLKNYTLHSSDINKLMSAIRYIYKPSLDAGLTKILGKEGDVSTLRGRKTLVTRGYEWIYTGYVEAYEDGVKELGVTHPTREQKREVARSLQGTYYPKYQSAWDDTGENETFIDILTSKQVDSTETIQYEYAMPGYTTYYKGAKPLSESARKSKDAKTRNTTLYTTEPASPGAKAIVNATQSVDADSIGTVSEILEFLSLYDAGQFSIKDLQKGKELYNDVFINMNLAHNFMEVTIENMKKLQKLLAKDPDRAKAVAERYFKESHETKHLPFDSPIREEVTLSAAITSLEDALRNVKRELLLLEGLNKVTEEVVKKDGTTETLTHYPNVYQLNWPDVSKVTDNADTHYSLKANIGAQVHRMFYTEGSAKNVSDLFDFFGNRAKKFYHSPEAYAKETRQLGEVIDKLILPAVGILDNLSIEGLSAKTFAHGKYEPGKTKVTVTANKSKPETYSESTGQEVYVHELVHAITQVGIEHDSAIRPELQRIYNYLRKEVTVNDFLDPHTLKSEQAEKEAAQRIYDRVFGKTSSVTSELHELMAHGLTNPALIRKLETLKPVTANMDLEGRSVLEAFHNIIERIVNVFRRVFNGEKVPKNIHDQLFSLAQRINTINMDQRGAVAKYLYNKNIVLRHKQANTLFAKGVNYVLNGGAKKVGDHLSKRREKRKENPSKSIVVRTLKNIENIPLIGAKLISSKQARKAMEKSISRANGAVGNFVRSTINELGSLTPMEFVNMMFLSNKNVDAERRKAKELLASVLKSSFVGKKEPTHHQLVALTRFVLKTDASALLHNDTYTMDEVLNMFKDPKYLAQQLQKYHAKLDTANNSYYRNNVNGLADLMVFGETTQNNSMMNAYFISTLGSKSNIKDWEDLDMLISLVAIHKTVNAFEGAQEDLVKLINSEMSVNRDVNGVTEMILEHQAFKTRARDKNFTDKNGNVQYGLMAKGYIAKLYDSTHDMVTEPLRVPKKSLTGKVVKGSDGKPVMIDNIEVMRKLGYEYQGKVPDVNGLNIGPVGLFVNKLIVETGRTKGIASATALKAFGTSIMGILAKNVLLKGQLRSTIGLMVRSEGAKATDKNTNGVHAKAPRAMIPRRNSTGKIVDYRISIKHDKVEALLNQNLDAIEVLATMESHMIDKEASEEVNDSIIKLLTKDRKSMSAKDAHNWVDILSLDYHEEYVSNFPKKMRQAIVRNSTIDDKGKAQFFVQKRVLDVAFGFKQVSVGDALPDGRFKRVATLVEGLWQWATHRAIVNVVVKIPAVGTANVTSNFGITLLHGMWPHKTIAALYKAWKALDQYQADVDTLTKMIYKAQARPELLNNPKIKRKMELLGNNISKNRLHKFMSRGLFTSITEDIHVSEHASKRSIDAFVKDRFGITIPKPMIKAAQHLYLGSTTPTGNALVKFLQMSDFLFRVVLFEHRVNKSGWSEQRAWNLIVKTFISYDVPLNKHAQYANDMSVIWFYKYWVRIQYVAFNEIKKRPANALLYFFGQELIDTDSPDIFDSSFIDGNFMPTDAGILKTLEELLVPPAFEIATGESL